MTRIMLITIGALLTTGCMSAGGTTVEDVIGVTAEENASLCIEASGSGSFFNTEAGAKRIEVPASLDMTNFTLEDLEALEGIICPD